MTMQVTQVDERDSGWEDHSPRFRVHLLESGATSTYGASDTYDVTGADVLQVIDWAQRRAGDRLTYAVALVRDEPERGTHTRGLVWLVGMDGNDSTDDGSPGRRTQERMLTRRTEPAQIAPADRAPYDG